MTIAELEKYMIGLLLLNEARTHDILRVPNTIVLKDGSSHHFECAPCLHIFRAIVDCKRWRRPVDIVSVTNQLKNNGHGENWQGKSWADRLSRCVEQAHDVRLQMQHFARTANLIQAGFPNLAPGPSSPSLAPAQCG